MRDFDDETLMAFVDGEADEVTTAEIEAALETDEPLAERIAVFMDSRAALAGAMKPLIDEPVPEALLASVQASIAAAAARASDTAETVGETSGRVLPFKPAGKRRRPVWGTGLAMPVAASILAVAFGLGGFLTGRLSAPQGGDGATAAIAQALSSEASGRDIAIPATGETLHLVASFRDAGGVLCREYERRSPGATSATIACRTNGAWVSRLTVAKAVTGDGYSPASGEETIDAYLGAIGATAALGIEEESVALETVK